MLAAKRLLVKLRKRWGFMSKRFITDKQRSYGAAKRKVAPGLDHWSHKSPNNRAENSHLKFRKRERTMQGFRSPGRLQRFVFISPETRNTFAVLARRRTALAIRYNQLEAFNAWQTAAKAV
ncbi:MAG: DDE-type integrase/transposase/recombinase [Sedimentitalea sp.]|uniref:DDE-type integrase/transposase/recombinase n=1 Tax=Sedimentitalea sp. TaxID=2048915 RepID=UPI0032661CBA